MSLLTNSKLMANYMLQTMHNCAGNSLSVPPWNVKRCLTQWRTQVCWVTITNGWSQHQDNQCEWIQRHQFWPSPQHHWTSKLPTSFMHTSLYHWLRSMFATLCTKIGNSWDSVPSYDWATSSPNPELSEWKSIWYVCSFIRIRIRGNSWCSFLMCEMRSACFMHMWWTNKKWGHLQTSAMPRVRRNVDPESNYTFLKYLWHRFLETPGCSCYAASCFWWWVWHISKGRSLISPWWLQCV